MLGDVDEIEALLGGTVLDGAAVRAVPVLETTEVAFEIEVPRDSVLDGWRASRGLV